MGGWRLSGSFALLISCGPFRVSHAPALRAHSSSAGGFCPRLHIDNRSRAIRTGTERMVARRTVDQLGFGESGGGCFRHGENVSEIGVYALGGLRPCLDRRWCRGNIYCSGHENVLETNETWQSARTILGRWSSGLRLHNAFLVCPRESSDRIFRLRGTNVGVTSEKYQETLPRAIRGVWTEPVSLRRFRAKRQGRCAMVKSPARFRCHHPHRSHQHRTIPDFVPGPPLVVQLDRERFLPTIANLFILVSRARKSEGVLPRAQRPLDGLRTSAMTDSPTGSLQDRKRSHATSCPRNR